MSYPASPTTTRAWTAVSLFSGAGGLDVGLEEAGFRVVTLSDSDPDCVATLRLNQARRIPVPGGASRRFLEGARILHAPVEALSARDLRPPGSSREWAPDLLVGGPPCQPFSSAGKQLSFDDPRGRLFEHFVRLATELAPRMILFENVRGLVTARGPDGEPGAALRKVNAAFERIGYATSFALLNAADFGVPQRRVRLFMLATRSGRLPEFPPPSHCEDPRADLLETRLPWLTLGEFLAAFGPPQPDEVVRPSPSLARMLSGVEPGTGLRSPGAREATRPGGHWGYKQGTFLADLKKPARTVTAASTQDWVRLADQGLRRLTWRECAGLQGFPRDWEFVGGKASRFRQIGNAVPTALGRILGVKLAEARASWSRAGRPASASLPRALLAAIEYTARDQRRNAASRRLARMADASDRQAVSRFKGRGSQDRPAAAAAAASSRRGRVLTGSRPRGA